MIGIAVVALILVVVAVLYFKSRGKESTDDAYVTGHVHPVSARISGTVEHVDVDDNDLVTEGQVIVRLDPRDNLVSRDKAAASLTQAEAQLLQAPRPGATKRGRTCIKTRRRSNSSRPGSTRRRPTWNWRPSTSTATTASTAKTPRRWRSRMSIPPRAT